MAISQKQVCEALGLSKAQVSKDVAAGMPLTSVAAAQAWRLANKPEGIGHKGGSAEVAAAVAASIGAPPPRVAGPLQTAPDDPAGTLGRMREIEQRQYSLINEALKKAEASRSPVDYSVLPGLFRAYNTAGANALAAAAAWERHCRSAGEVAPVEHLMNVLTARLEPLAARLKNFPAAVGAKANPTAPAMAEAAIEAEMKTILEQIDAALEPVPAAPEENAA